MTRFGILGDLVVEASGGRILVPRAKQRALLGVLLLHAGTPMSLERLSESVWGEAPPASSHDLVRMYVSQLRDVLGDEVIETRAGAYVISADVELDATSFRALVDKARLLSGSGDSSQALATYDDALSLWRGSVLADSPVEGDARIECRLLEDLRLTALEERFDAALALKPAHELVAELEAQVAAQPARERLRALLMLALYRSGRQADALAAYRDARTHLSNEFGLEPGPELRELERRILDHDPSLAGRTQSSNPPPRPLRRASLALGFAAVIGVGTTFALVSRSSTPLIRPRSVAAVDARTGRTLADVPLEAPVTAVTAGHGIVLAGTTARTIAEVDPQHAKVLRAVGVATVPHAVAFAAGSIWVANAFDGTLTRIGLDGFAAPTSRPEPGARGHLTLASDGAALWVGSQDNVLTRLAGDRNPTASARALHPESATVAFGSVWVAQGATVDVRRVDERTGRFEAQVPLGSPCTSLAATATSIWALSPASAKLWRIDPATNAVTAAITVDPDSTLVVAHRRAVWVIATSSGLLQRVDPGRNRIAAFRRLGRSVGGAVLAGNRLWLGMR
ncbi:MAG: BTAD domain-containing putative transcriptional regulator [Gaiellaceae bacterium]